MKKILFFSEAVTLAHLGRPLVLASALDHRLYETHFAYSQYREKMLDSFQNNVTATYKLQSQSPSVFLENISNAQPLFDRSTLSDYVNEDLELIARVKPDLVVGDLRLSLGASAEIANVPYATIVNSYWSPYAQIKYEVPELPITRVLGKRVGQTFFDFIRPFAFADHSLPLNIVRMQHGLHPIHLDVRHVYTHAKYVLFADTDSYTLMSKVPNNYNFIGPILWDTTQNTPDWWTEMPEDKPIVYLTLGSSGSVSLMSILTDVLGDMPITVMLATADRLGSTKWPDNFYVSNFLPGVKCAARSQLVICNGGSGTTAQALAAGVPILGMLSDNMDQYLNMANIERLHAGKALRSHEIERANLKNTIDDLLKNEMVKKSLVDIKEDWLHWDARKNFVSLMAKMCP